MSALTQFHFVSILKTYVRLTKPGIIGGNAMTAFAGFAFASQQKVDIALLIMTLLGLCLIMASGCVSNNYLDRHIDQKMARVVPLFLWILPSLFIVFSLFKIIRDTQLKSKK